MERYAKVVGRSIEEPESALNPNNSHLKPQENWGGLVYISDESDEDNGTESDSTIENSLSDCDMEEVNSVEVEEQSYESTDEEIGSIVFNAEDETTNKKINKNEPKKRGKLLKPFPQFCLVEQMPKQRTKKRSVIQNANSMATNKTMRVLFLTTSPLSNYLVW